MSAIDAEQFPKGALIAVSAMVGFSLIATAAVRLERLSAPHSQGTAVTSSPATASADLRFTDEADGSIRITDAKTDRLVSTVKPGEGGFIRGVMRGLARDRISRHIGEKPPFHLWLGRDNQLWLQDTATARLIDLQSFGGSNREAFKQLLSTFSVTS